MASASFEPTAEDLARLAIPTFVTRYQGEVLPNIRFLGCRFDEGAETGQGTFRYVFDTGGGVDVGHEWPTTPEAVMGPDASGPFVVQPDDRLCVYAVTPEADQILVFDGFAAIPAATISAAHDKLAANFVCQGTPVRCWDTPMFGRVQRDSDQYDITDDLDYQKTVDLPIVFNPNRGHLSTGIGNATADGNEGTFGGTDDEPGWTAAIFLDELFIQDNASTDIGQFWTVPMAVKYILASQNTAETYINNPDFSTLDDLLNSRKPVTGEYYDSNDPTSYKASPIILKETDVTGLCWPDAINRIIYSYGLRMRFDLTQDDSSMGAGSSPDPIWTINFSRLDDADPDHFQQLFIQDGGPLDPAQTNVAEMHLAHDQTEVANAYEVETALAQYEIAAVLAPLFPIDPADATTLAKFSRTTTSSITEGYENYYRLYGFDECGEGHTDVRTGEWIEGAAPGLWKVLGGPMELESNYVRRRRPGSSKLLSTTTTGDNRDAILLISWDYTGQAPALWDGSGTWYQVTHNWKMMDDRLGIYLKCDNPDGWPVGDPKIQFGVNARSSGGKVCGVRAQALAGETRFFLMLATVITGDQVGQATSSKRSASPSKFTVQRIVDARERFKRQLVTANSWYNQTPSPVVTRDDFQLASDDADTRRSANEMPKLSGVVEIPRFATIYAIGDRLTSVVGRDLNLQTNIGDSGGESPLYPRIIGIEYQFDPEQRTRLQVTDDRGWKRSDSHG